MAKTLFIIISLFGNLWIWKIFSFSIPLGLLLLLTTLLLINEISNNKILKHRARNRFAQALQAGVQKDNVNKNFRWILLTLFSTLLFFQINTTSIQSLTQMTNDDIRIRDSRLLAYSPVKFSVGEKTIWIPVAHWFEGRKETIATFRILDNFSESMDPNLYFFANHPRGRVGVDEFEKFPYILLPFFIAGVFVSLSKKSSTAFTLSFILPTILISFIGMNNSLGSFSIFPFISVSVYWGLISAHTFSIKKKLPKYVIWFGLTTFILIFAQTIIYEL